MLSQEVGFIEDEGGIAYRDVDAIVRSLRRDDRVMSVDLERFRRGERTELMCGFLSGGLPAIVCLFVCLIQSGYSR